MRCNLGLKREMGSFVMGGPCQLPRLDRSDSGVERSTSRDGISLTISLSCWERECYFSLLPNKHRPLLGSRRVVDVYGYRFAVELEAFGSLFTLTRSWRSESAEH